MVWVGYATVVQFFPGSQEDQIDASKPLQALIFEVLPSLFLSIPHAICFTSIRKLLAKVIREFGLHCHQ